MHLDQNRSRNKLLLIALCGICGLGLVFGLLLLTRQLSVSANSADIAAVQARYPNIAASRIDSCDLCHTASLPNLNPYGLAYQSAGRSSAALAAIDSNDTDGDGFSNGTELMARTFPGDANSHPEKANSASLNNIAMQYPYPPPGTVEPYPAPPTDVPPTATKTATRTNTAVPPTAVPPTATRTNTAIPPTATRTNTAVPPTATRTNTAVPPTAIPPTATRTNTAVPPTAVPPTATGTNTAVPPTATPVAPTATSTLASYPVPGTPDPYPGPVSASPTATNTQPAPSNTAQPPTHTPPAATNTAQPAANTPLPATATKVPTKVASATAKATQAAATRTPKPRITRTSKPWPTAVPTRPRITRTPGPKPTHVEKTRLPTRTPWPTLARTPWCRPDNSAGADQFGHSFPCPTHDRGWPRDPGGRSQEDVLKAISQFIEGFLNNLANWFK